MQYTRVGTASVTLVQRLSNRWPNIHASCLLVTQSIQHVTFDLQLKQPFRAMGKQKSPSYTDGELSMIAVIQTFITS